MPLVNRTCYFNPGAVLVGITWQDKGWRVQVYIYLLCWVIDLQWHRQKEAPRP
jgi:hypothetical protein